MGSVELQAFHYNALLKWLIIDWCVHISPIFLKENTILHISKDIQSTLMRYPMYRIYVCARNELHIGLPNKP